MWTIESLELAFLLYVLAFLILTTGAILLIALLLKSMVLPSPSDLGEANANLTSELTMIEDREQRDWRWEAHDHLPREFPEQAPSHFRAATQGGRRGDTQREEAGSLPSLQGYLPGTPGYLNNRGYSGEHIASWKINRNGGHQGMPK